MNEEKLKPWRCGHCGETFREDKFLRAQNPFSSEENDIIVGCPSCKSIGEFSQLCDEPKCLEEATCGFPVKIGFGGYRRTCGKHYRELNHD
jgi:hypothetical protein